MNIFTKEVISYFDSLNEYDTRTYLRDCVDIFAYNKKELERHYPIEVFNFLKLARIVKHEQTARQFVEFIEEITNFDEKTMKVLISNLAISAEKALIELENNLRRIKEEAEYMIL